MHSCSLFIDSYLSIPNSKNLQTQTFERKEFFHSGAFTKKLKIKLTVLLYVDKVIKKHLIHPSIHPWYSPPSFPLIVCLFSIHADSVTQCPSDPKSQADPPVASNTHWPPPALLQSSPGCTACVWAVPSLHFLHLRLVLRIMCECLRGIFRVTWAPSSSTGQIELMWSTRNEAKCNTSIILSAWFGFIH